MNTLGITGVGSHAGPQTPDLLTHLWDKYQAHLEDGLAKLVADGCKTLPIQDVVLKAPARNFVAWAKTYLEANRVTETFAADGNFGARLNDATVVMLCPGEAIEAGSMEPSHAVPITTGKGG